MHAVKRAHQQANRFEELAAGADLQLDVEAYDVRVALGYNANSLHDRS
jgi:hypothetical protein